jgi:ribosomal protein S18 acetylase RimI-like enzyme
VRGLTDEELYRRGAETLVASWERYARGAVGASLRRSAGVATAVFPNEPERSVYNNALLDQGLSAGARDRAVSAMEASYAAAGLTRFAAWVHESDQAMRSDLLRRGYTIDETTRAMGMTLGQRRLRRPVVALGAPDWAEHLRLCDLPTGFLSDADPDAFRVLVAQLRNENAATAIALHHAGDCGIYNVGTLAHARRRGLATALTVLHLHDARTRGCLTASLQSTPMAESVYAAVGFRDLGRILEFTPAHL